LVVALSALGLRAASPNLDDAQALIAAGHFKRAGAILETQVKLNPQDARAACLLAQVKIAFEDLDAALAFAQRAVTLEVGNPKYHYQLARVYGEMASRASLFAAASRARKFKNELDAALALDPKNLDALEALMEYSFQAPRLMGGDKDKAHALSDEIERLDPVRGNLARAELAREDKKPGEIEAFFQKAVAAGPRDYEARVALAGFYSSPAQKKNDLALQHARMALSLDKGRAKAYSILAQVYVRLERWSELEDLLASALKEAPDDLAPYYTAAQAMVGEDKDLVRAGTYLHKYLSQEPEGEEPDAAHAHRLLGLVLEKQKRRAEACQELETALRLKPGFKAAKEDLKRVSGK